MKEKKEFFLNISNTNYLISEKKNSNDRDIFIR